MDDTTKTLLGLAVRRGLTIAGTYLAGKGIVQGDAGVTTFVGAGMVLVEAGYEAWNRYGMVLVNAQLAKLKGVHPSQVSSTVPPTPGAGVKPLILFAVLAGGAAFSIACGSPASALAMGSVPGSAAVAGAQKNKPRLFAANSIKLPIPLPAPAPAATAAAPAAPSLADSIEAFINQLQTTDATIIKNTIAALQAADDDAATVVTPATATAPAVVKDPISHACYPAEIQYLQALPTMQTTDIPAPYNLIVLFQYKRDFVNLLLSGQLIPTYLKLGCAPLLGDEAQIFAGTLGLVGVSAAMLNPITAFGTSLGAATVNLLPLLALPK